MPKEIAADYSGVEPQAGGGSYLLPIKDSNGKRIRYLGRIEDAVPKTGKYPYVQYTLKVVGGDFDGVDLRYQNCTFLPKEHEYAGISLHFLKCLREPFEGKFKIVPDAWVGRHIFFYVKHDKSTKINEKTGEEYVNNAVAGVDVVDIPTLIDLGEIEDAGGAPEWLQEAQAAMETQGKAASEKAKAPEKSAPDPEPEQPKGKKKAAEAVSPDAPCEVCERPFKNHKGLKHEFKEGVPF